MPTEPAQGVGQQGTPPALQQHPWVCGVGGRFSAAGTWGYSYQQMRSRLIESPLLGAHSVLGMGA